MTKEELRSLTIEQLNGMTEEQLNVVANEVVEKLVDYEINRLSKQVKNKLQLRIDNDFYILRTMLGISLILIGLIVIPKIITPSIYEVIGRFIGVVGITFLPAYFLLKKKKSFFSILKDKCNPANYMNPYDELKVKKANAIFNKLMTLNSSDMDALMELRAQAIKELGINFYNKSYIEHLKKRCNPKRFMNPYNAEKVQLANDLYSKLLTYSNIEELEKVERVIKYRLHIPSNTIPSLLIFITLIIILLAMYSSGIL